MTKTNTPFETTGTPSLKTSSKFKNVRDFLENKHKRIKSLKTDRKINPFVNLVKMELVDAINYLGFSIKQNIRNQRTLTIKDNIIIYLDDNLEAKFEAELELELIQHNIKYSKDTFDSAIKVMKADNKHCPFQKKLEELKWDGISRLNNEYLNKYFIDVDSVFGNYFKAFLVSAIGRLYNGHFQSPVWILGGKQGLGKSYFTKWVASVFEVGGHAERHINPDSKDDLAICCETPIIEIAEAISTFKKDREILKKHFSAGSFSFRSPYSKYNDHRPHCSSYIATANLGGLGILKDPTGNRRFIICELENILQEYSKEIDVNQLWAEALTLYHSNKERLNLNYEGLIDIKIRDSINLRFASRPIEHDDLDDIIQFTGQELDRVKPIEIISRLQVQTGNKDRNILRAIVVEYLTENYGIKQEKGKLAGENTSIFKGVKLK